MCHSTDVKELYRSRGWPRLVHGRKAAITEPSRAKSYGQLPLPQELGVWTVSSCLCVILGSSFRCTLRQCACSTGKNTPIPPKPHYNMQSLPLEVSRTIFLSHLEWSQSWPGFKQDCSWEQPELSYDLRVNCRQFLSLVLLTSIKRKLRGALQKLPSGYLEVCFVNEGDFAEQGWQFSIVHSFWSEPLQVNTWNFK